MRQGVKHYPIEFKGALLGLRQFTAAESPLFTSKALLVAKIFKFLSWLFGHVAKRLTIKNRLIQNFMTSHPG